MERVTEIFTGIRALGAVLILLLIGACLLLCIWAIIASAMG